MLKIAAIILSIEEFFQFLISALSLIISISGKYAPILRIMFTKDELSALDSKYVVTTKALAIMHNSGATISTFLFLVVVWTGLIHGYKWAFLVLLAVGILGHAFWFVGDSFIGNKTLIVNSILTAIFLAGIVLAGYSIFKG